TVVATGCREMRLPFDDRDYLATLRPGANVIAQCTLQYWDRVFWEACEFGAPGVEEQAPQLDRGPPADVVDPPDEQRWFCACLSERPDPTPGTDVAEDSVPTDPVPVTACRASEQDCARLVARARRGTGTVAGVVSSCAPVAG